MEIHYDFMIYYIFTLTEMGQIHASYEKSGPVGAYGAIMKVEEGIAVVEKKDLEFLLGELAYADDQEEQTDHDGFNRIKMNCNCSARTCSCSCNSCSCSCRCCSIF
jgi:hypothetical protein